MRPSIIDRSADERGARVETVNVVVLGGKGAGAFAAFALQRIEARQGRQRFAGFLNDTVEPGGSIAGAAVLGPFDAWAALPTATKFLAPLHKAKEMMSRAARIRGLGIPARRWASVIDPDCLLSADASHGHNVFLSAFASIMPSVRLGSHVQVRGGAHIGHDAIVGDFSFVGINSVICGYCRIANGVHVAPGALIGQGLEVGRFSVVGLGAVVVRNVPEFAIVAGNPARVIGEVQPLRSRAEAGRS